VWDYYREIFKPENVVVAVGGKFSPDAAKASWDVYAADWTADKRYHPVDKSPTDEVEITAQSVSGIEIRGAGIAVNDPQLAAKYLALVALGCGKGSSMHRIIREEHAWSYRQEGVVSPAPEGLEPRLIFFVKPRSEQVHLGWLARDALLADIDKWTATDLARAVGYASIYFDRGIAIGPMVMNGGDYLTSELEDETFLKAYWRLRGGKWDANAFMGSLRDVQLDDLKAAAKSMLSGSSIHVTPAGG
jgi:hypothetical protein